MRTDVASTIGGQTRINYTGQKRDDTGLLYYHARMYDPALGRFVSPDSIVPGASSGVGGAGGTVGQEENSKLTVDFHESGFLTSAAKENATALQKGFWFQLSGEDRQQARDPWGPRNPQALSRYAYVLNNPLRYTDPSGHTWYLDYKQAKDFANSLHDLAAAISFGGSIAEVVQGAAIGIVAELIGAIAAAAGIAIAALGVVGALAVGYMLERFATAIDRANDDGMGNAGLGVAIQFTVDDGTADGGFFEILNRSTGQVQTFSAPLMNWFIGRNSSLGFQAGLGNDLDPSVPSGYYFNNNLTHYYGGGRSAPAGFSCNPNPNRRTIICPPRQ